MILDIQQQLKDRIEHRVVTTVNQEYHLKSSMKIKPNQTLFSLNLETMVVESVPIVMVINEILPDKSGRTRIRVNADPKCIYYGAYNGAMASRHFIKILNQFYKHKGLPVRTELALKNKSDSTTDAGQADIDPDPETD